MEQEESHRWGKSTHYDLPSLRKATGSGTWNLASRRWISTSAEPESNFEKSESGAWILIPVLLVPLDLNPYAQ